MGGVPSSGLADRVVPRDAAHLLPGRAFSAAFGLVTRFLNEATRKKIQVRAGGCLGHGQRGSEASDCPRPLAAVR